MVEYTPRKNKEKNHTTKNKIKPHQQRCGKEHTKKMVWKNTHQRRKEEKMNKVEFGERIAKVRQHFGLSQAQFAQKVNRSPGLFSKVEKGRSDISEETINVIVEVYGVNKFETKK